MCTLFASCTAQNQDFAFVEHRICIPTLVLSSIPLDMQSDSVQTREMDHSAENIFPVVKPGSAGLDYAIVVGEPVGSSVHCPSQEFPEASIATDNASGHSGQLGMALNLSPGGVSLAVSTPISGLGIDTASNTEGQCTTYSAFIGSSGYSDTGSVQLSEDDDDIPMASAAGVGASPGLPRAQLNIDLAGVDEKEWFEAQDFPGLIANVVLEFNSDGRRRDLTCLDLFAGSGAVSKAFSESGHSTVSYDIVIDPSCDFTSKKGFLNAVLLVLRLESGGLIMAGPPCSLWIFLSSSVHRRSDDCPEGDTSNRKVRMSNLIVRNLAVLLAIADSRGVFWIIEQPHSSSMWKYPPLKQYLDKCNAQRCFTCMGCFGHDLLKPTVLWGTLPSLEKLSRKKRQCLSSSSSEVVRSRASRYYHRSDSGGVRGNPALHDSASYSAAFGQAVLFAWGLAVGPGEGRCNSVRIPELD